MKAFFGLVLIFSVYLSGCSSTQKVYWYTLSYALNETPDVEFSVEELMNIPVDLVYSKNGEAARAAMALAYLENNQNKWISSDKIILVTENGRLIRTSGLDRDLLATTNLDEDILKRDGFGVSDSNWSRIIDYDDQFNVRITTGSVKREQTRLTVLGKEFLTTKVTETVKEENSQASWQNTFWFDTESGELLQSIQKMHSQANVIEIVRISVAARLISAQGE